MATILIKITKQAIASPQKPDFQTNIFKTELRPAGFQTELYHAEPIFHQRGGYFE